MRDLQPLLRVAVPSLAAAMAGFGVLIVLLDHPASSASRMAETTEPAAPSAGRPCEQQSWPHIDRRCLSANAAQASRKVRLITTDRLEVPPAVEAVAAEPAPTVADVVALAPPAPQPATTQPAVRTPAPIPVMAMTEVQKPKPVRRSAKRERRRAPATVQRTYEVPAYDAHQGTRRVTVTTQSRYEELFARPRF